MSVRFASAAAPFGGSASAKAATVGRRLILGRIGSRHERTNSISAGLALMPHGFSAITISTGTHMLSTSASLIVNPAASKARRT
jgi:hypothetical protein